MIGKVIGGASGTTTAVADAINWALTEGAHVVSLSLGFDFPALQMRLQQFLPPDIAASRALEQYRANIRLFDKLGHFIGVNSPYGRGPLLVAAAGNESRRDERADFTVRSAPPAEADDVLSVAALDRDDDGNFKVAPFSNTGPQLAAPGMNVLSAALGGGLTRQNGTSMAAPHVAGVAALWAERQLQTQGFVNAQELQQELLQSTLRLSPKLFRQDVGAGCVQAPLEEADENRFEGGLRGG